MLLAIPSLPRSKRRRIVAELQRQAIPVLQISLVDDITSGRARIDALRPVAIEDLLGRDPVPTVPELLGPGLRDAVVCVTGAGGSIGSELCRRLPRDLVRAIWPALHHLPNHPGDLPEGTLRAILRHAGVSVEYFLSH